jgi:hypothetical protein
MVLDIPTGQRCIALEAGAERCGAHNARNGGSLLQADLG